MSESEVSRRQLRFCSSCGTQVRPGNAFCMSCGERVSSEGHTPEQAQADQSSRRPHRGTKRKRLHAGLLIFGVIAVIALALMLTVLRPQAADVWAWSTDGLTSAEAERVEEAVQAYIDAYEKSSEESTEDVLTQMDRRVTDEFWDSPRGAEIKKEHQEAPKEAEEASRDSELLSWEITKANAEEVVGKVTSLTRIRWSGDTYENRGYREFVLVKGSDGDWLVASSDYGDQEDERPQKVEDKKGGSEGDKKGKEKGKGKR